MTTTEIQLYNDIYNTENPFNIFNNIESPYYDYHRKLLETDTYYANIRRVEVNKLNNWNMSMDQQIGNLLIVYYASYFELFAKDDILETFYLNFQKYCEAVFSDNSGYIFKDINGDTFIHYASCSFDCRKAIANIYRMTRTNKKSIYNPLHMKNLYNISPNDILLLK